MNRVANKLDKFINDGFDDDGKHTSNKLIPTPSKKACRFCEFNQTEHCHVGVK